MTGVGSDERVRQLADEILQRAEYAHWRALGSEGWVADVGGRIGALLEWLIGLPARQPTLSWALEAALLATAALLLAHIAWSVRAALNASAAIAREAAEPTGPDWLRDAENAAAAGRFLDAAHLLQLGTLDELLRRGLLRLGRSEPNRVLRQRLRDLPIDASLRDGLIALVDRLETSWFRGEKADATLYRDWLGLFVALRARS